MALLATETKDEDTKQWNLMRKLVIFCGFSCSRVGLLDRQVSSAQAAQEPISRKQSAKGWRYWKLVNNHANY